MPASKDYKQRLKKQYRRDVIEHLIKYGLLSEPVRDFESLARAEKRCVLKYERAASKRLRGMNSAELVWRLIWGPEGEWILNKDNGKPTHTRPLGGVISLKETLRFHFNNLFGDVSNDERAAAVRFFRRLTAKDPSIEGTARQISKVANRLLEGTAVAASPEL